MKQAIIFLSLFCIISCRQEQAKPTSSLGITVLNDVTDPRMIKPDAEFPLALCELDKEKNKAVFFRLTSTTDMLLNPAWELYLSTAAMMEKENSTDDPYFREKHVLAFYDKVRQVTENNNTNAIDSTRYKHSECFRSICREIELLQKKKWTSSILIIYSDLQENSDIENMYNQDTIDTAKIKQDFSKTKLLSGNLSRLSAYFIFQPKNREEDKRFMAMYEIYQKLLEEKGANVFLQSGNN